MRTSTLVRVGFCVLAFAATSSAISPLQSNQQKDAVSREFVFSAGVVNNYHGAISREIALCAGVTPQYHGAVSREFIFSVAVTPQYHGAISREFIFNTAQARDLEIAGTSVPTTGTANQAFQVRWRVRNLGQSAANGPWNDRVVFSVPIRLPSGALVTSYPLAGPTTLVAGDFYDRSASFVMPPNATSFTIKILTDADQVVPESNENNNTWGPTNVNVSLPLPNLAVRVDPHHPMAMTHHPESGSLDLIFTVRNDGQAPTDVPSWTDRVFLVHDTSNCAHPANEDGYVASWAFQNETYLVNDPGGNGSLPGSSYTQSVTLQLPASVSGSFFLAVRTDANGAQPESDETDNLAWSSCFTIDPAPHPDLEVSNIELPGVTPGTPVPSGTLLTVQWQVRNLGNADYLGGSFVTQIWVSNDLVVDGPGALLMGHNLLLGSFTESLGALHMNGMDTATATHEVFLPVDLPVGALGASPFALKVRIDAQDTVVENESHGAFPYWNNLVATSGMILDVRLSATPDLIATSIAPTTSQGPPQIAHPLEVAWTVTRDHSPGWDIPLTWGDQVWLCHQDAQHQPMPGTDALLGTFYQSTILDQSTWIIPASYSHTQSFAMPQWVTPNTTYFLVLVVDANNDVFEHSGMGELNNRCSSPVSFENNPADLEIEAQVAGVVPPTEGTVGQTIHLPWTVTNLSATGTTSTSIWTDRVYLSPSQADLGGATLLVSSTHSGVLTPGSSYSISPAAVVPNLPSGTPGYLHFLTDIGNSVYEDGATANNEKVTPFVVVGSVANLVVDQVVATTETMEGMPIQVNWIVHNVGSAATLVSHWIDTVYLADSQDIDHASNVHALGSRLWAQGLGADATYSASQSFNVPLGLTPGFWYVVVRTDATNQVFEDNHENDNTRATRTQITIDTNTGGGGGGGGDGGTGNHWLPSNLVAQNVQILNGPVTAGQPVKLAWDISNTGVGATNVNHWSDEVYLSADSVLDSADIPIGYHDHTTFIDAGGLEHIVVRLDVPLWANGDWFVFVHADVNGAVYQNGATQDDVAASTMLLHVVAPPPTNLQVTSATLPQQVLLGETLDVDWTTSNTSPTTDVPAEWGWTDSFWLLPAGETLPSPHLRFLGQIASTAGLIAHGGTYTQPSGMSLTVPGLAPMRYQLLVQTDALNQISETNENDNTYLSTATVDLKAIPIALDGSATATLASGSSRWFELDAPADQTVLLNFVHNDPTAHCEMYVRANEPPSLGTYDLAAENLGAIDPHQQSITIPQTSASKYFILVRNAMSSGGAPDGTLNASSLPFAVTGATPGAVGAGVVTIQVAGSQLWRATSVQLADPESGGSTVATARGSNVAHLADGSVLARFDLTGLTPQSLVLTALDDTMQPAAGSAPIVVQPAAPLALHAEISMAPTIRRGETGSGVLRLVNAGNVDVPYSLVTLARRDPRDTPTPPTRMLPAANTDPSGSLSPQKRVILTAPNLGVPGAESDGEKQFFVLTVEDLGPGQVHEISLQAAVGADFPLEFTPFVVAGMPLTKPAFVAGPFTQISHALREALMVDPSTPSTSPMLNDALNDEATWDSLVATALASGAIAIDLTTIHTPNSLVRTSRELAQAIANGIDTLLMLPQGAHLPESSISAAAKASSCVPFVGTSFDCDSLFASECSDSPSTADVTTQTGGNATIGAACVETPEPHDPNVKYCPAGVGPNHLVSGTKPIQYEVHFQNQATATAWASRIEITDPIEPGLDSSSVRFLELRLGPAIFHFPPNISSYVGQVPVQVAGSTNVVCQISALVDALTNTMDVVLQALDPSTGMPSSLGTFGLLPPAVAGMEHDASGYLTFTVVPDSQAPSTPAQTMPSHSMQLRSNTTFIKMNAAAPLGTNMVQNMLDDHAPTSSITSATADVAQVTIMWQADDTESLPAGVFPGAGVHDYSLYARSSDQGPWVPLLLNSTATSFTYTAPLGQTLGFKVESTDNVGNVESKSMPDATVSTPPDCNGNGIPDDQDIANGTATDINHDGIPDSCECVVSSFCSMPDSLGHMAMLAPIGLPSISSGTFALSVAAAAPHSVGVLEYATADGQTSFGDGFLCLTGTFARFPSVVTASDGSANLPFDFNAPPLGSGPHMVHAGETRYFQFLFRDLQFPGAIHGYDLTNALRITFCP